MLAGSKRDVQIHHRSIPAHRHCIRINAAAFEEVVYRMQFSSSSVPLQSVWEETSTFLVLMLPQSKRASLGSELWFPTLKVRLK